MREIVILERIKAYFGIGSIYLDQKDNTFRYVVSGKRDMIQIVSFFQKFKLKSKKQRDFLLFRKALLSKDIGDAFIFDVKTSEMLSSSM
jgi:hypothetical protein